MGDRRPPWCLLAGGLLGMALAGCASGGGKATPPASPEEVPPAVSEQTNDSEPAMEEAAAPETIVERMSPGANEQAPADPTEILIGPEPVLAEDPMGYEPKSITSEQGVTSLVEAARLERTRRGLDAPARIVINNENLDQFATGHLTVAGSPVEEGAGSDDSMAEGGLPAEGEEYWRSEARRIRQDWRDATDRVIELEEETFRLRQRFYAEDDGFYRDSQIKPAWDRAIEQLEAARREVVTRQQELDEFLERGRQFGALPGWLREGIELEPLPAMDPEEIHEPDEPPIYVEDDGASHR